MSTFAKLLATFTLALGIGQNAMAQADRPPAVLPLVSEAGPKIIVYPAQPDALARGVVILQFRTENFRVLPVFGQKAVEISPRLGHLHVTVEGWPGTWAHTSEDPVIITGLAAGLHKIRLELANPAHTILTSVTASVVVPDLKTKDAHAH